MSEETKDPMIAEAEQALAEADTVVDEDRKREPDEEEDDDEKDDVSDDDVPEEARTVGLAAAQDAFRKAHADYQQAEECLETAYAKLQEAEIDALPEATTFREWELRENAKARIAYGTLTESEIDAFDLKARQRFDAEMQRRSSVEYAGEEIRAGSPEAEAAVREAIRGL